MTPAQTSSDSFRNHRVLLVGLGLHGGGEATVRWLVKSGARVRVTDKKDAVELVATLKKLKKLPVKYTLGRHDLADFKWAQIIVQNPGVSAALPELAAVEKRGVPIVNEASIFVSSFPGPMIGVTGTRGKTTTTLLLGEIIKLYHRPTIVSGNVRNIAMLDYLPRATKSTWAVLELSSFQLERLPVAEHPLKVAVMTNLKVDHLSRHRTMSEYAAVKHNIFRGQTKSDYAVLNYGDLYARQASRISGGNIIWYGLKYPATRRVISLRQGWIAERQNGQWHRLFSQKSWALPGDHNLINLLAATAAARALDIPADIISQAVKKFRGLPDRQEVVRTLKGHKFVNDTTATSPDGTLAALNVYPKAMYIIGGTDKKLDFRIMMNEFARRHLPFVTLPGNATDKMMKILPKSLWYLAQPANSMVEAVRLARRGAKPGQEIILSPGAASFGLFVHEFDRGNKFVKAVKALT